MQHFKLPSTHRPLTTICVYEVNSYAAREVHVIFYAILCSCFQSSIGRSSSFISQCSVYDVEFRADGFVALSCHSPVPSALPYHTCVNEGDACKVKNVDLQESSDPHFGVETIAIDGWLIKVSVRIRYSGIRLIGQTRDVVGETRRDSTSKNMMNHSNIFHSVNIYHAIIFIPLHLVIQTLPCL